MSADVRTLTILGAVAAVAVASAVWAMRRKTPVAADPGLVRLARAATALSAAVWFLLVFGSSVRVNGAGLACPDWPACFGEVIPTIDWPVFLEFGHRAFAGGVSIGFVALAGFALRRPDLRRPLLPWFVAAAGALAVQIVLGGLTVWHLLAEWTVSSHLIGGNTFSALVAVVALSLRARAYGGAAEPIAGAWRAAGVALAALLWAQLALGGLVAATHAGLACGTWPGCNGPVWFPTFEGPMGLQVQHRVVAYTLLLGAWGAALASRGRGAVGRASWAFALVVTAQATLGVANVLLQLPVEVTLGHSAGAGLAVLAVTALNHAAWSSPVRHSVPAPAAALAEVR